MATEEGTARIVIDVDDAGLQAYIRRARTAEQRAAAAAERLADVVEGGAERGTKAFEKQQREATAAARRFYAEQERAAKAAEAARLREVKRTEAEIERTRKAALKQQARDEAAAAAASAKAAEQRSAALKGGAAAAAGAAAALAALFKESVDLNNALTDTATRTGLARDTIAGLQRAAEGSGLGLESLTPVLTQLPKRLADFHSGTGEAKSGLEALGLSARDLPLEDMDASLRTILEAIGQLSTDGERAAAANAIFGESGTMLGQAGLFAAGAIDRLADSARAAGLSNEVAAQSAAVAQQRFADLGQAARGAGTEFLAVFGPQANQIMRFWTEQIYRSIGIASTSIGDGFQFMATAWEQFQRVIFEGGSVKEAIGRTAAAYADLVDQSDALAEGERRADAYRRSSAASANAEAEARATAERGAYAAARERLVAQKQGAVEAQRNAAAIEREVAALEREVAAFEDLDPIVKRTRALAELADQVARGIVTEELAARRRAQIEGEYTAALEKEKAKQAAAEERAAKESAARAKEAERERLAALREEGQARQANAEVATDLTGSVADVVVNAAGRESKAAQVAATAEVFARQAVALAAALQAGPLAPLAIATYVAPVMSQAFASLAASRAASAVNDTAGVTDIRGEKTMSFAEGDTVVAARSRRDLERQVLRDRERRGRRESDSRPVQVLFRVGPTSAERLSTTAYAAGRAPPGGGRPVGRRVGG